LRRNGVVDRLNDLREPGMSYSDAIVRIAAAEQHGVSY
jgi:hypothetical protein